MGYLEEYLATRRAEWPYEDRYFIGTFGEYGYVARIGDQSAGLAWADVTESGGVKKAVMHMTLKPAYAEYGIGTELLHLEMENLQLLGCKEIRYTISIDHYAYQIYEHLGFEIEGRDLEEIHFVWKREQ